MPLIDGLMPYVILLDKNQGSWSVDVHHCKVDSAKCCLIIQRGSTLFRGF
jgi:hypothetical protein